MKINPRKQYLQKRVDGIEKHSLETGSIKDVKIVDSGNMIILHVLLSNNSVNRYAWHRPNDPDHDEAHFIATELLRRTMQKKPRRTIKIPRNRVPLEKL